MTPFAQKVLEIVKSIPEGGVMTYKAVAEASGYRNASRAVGSVLASNKDTSIPCHRVVRSDGIVGGYNGLRGKDKLELLKKEGVLVDGVSRIIF